VSRPAVAALEDARERVAALLWPPAPGRWLRLAVVTFFVGGAGGASGASGNLQSSLPVSGGGGGAAVPRLPDGDVDPTSVPTIETVWRWLAVVAAVVVVAVLLYVLVGSVAEFVLLGAIRDAEVGLLAGLRAYGGLGLRLFLFRVAVVLAALVFAVAPLALAAWAALERGAAYGLLAVPALLFGAVVAVAAWAVLTLTTDLVVPAVLASEAAGPLGGWRRVAPVLAGNLLDSTLYLVVRVALGVVAGVVVGFVGSLVALVAGVPFAVAGAAALATAGDTLSYYELGGLVAMAALFSLLTAGLLQLVRTPAVVYVRAYAAATLGRLSPELALLARDETDGSTVPGTGGD
jgi:hypothetical protein